MYPQKIQLSLNVNLHIICWLMDLKSIQLHGLFATVNTANKLNYNQTSLNLFKINGQQFLSLFVHL